MEQLYYLRAHDIIPAAVTLPVLGKKVGLNAKKLLQTSSRFYLAYILLEFFRLKERTGLLYTKQKALSRTNTNNVEADAELTNNWKAHQLATAYNACRLPGALHWYVHSQQSSVLLDLFFVALDTLSPRPWFLPWLALVGRQDLRGCVLNFRALV